MYSHDSAHAAPRLEGSLGLSRGDGELLPGNDGGALRERDGTEHARSDVAQAQAEILGIPDGALEYYVDKADGLIKLRPLSR